MNIYTILMISGGDIAIPACRNEVDNHRGYIGSDEPDMPEIEHPQKRKRLSGGVRVPEEPRVFGHGCPHLRSDSQVQWPREAYKGTVLQNEKRTGEFPVLEPGGNAVSWSGTVSRVVIKPNWRYL